MRARGEQGQATPLLAVVFLITFGVVMLLGHIGTVVLERSRAQTAADAAALAGAVEGRSGAADLARRNGARLVGFRVEGADTVVSVELGRAGASARARRGERSKSP